MVLTESSTLQLVDCIARATSLIKIHIQTWRCPSPISWVAFFWWLGYSVGSLLDLRQTLPQVLTSSGWRTFVALLLQICALVGTLTIKTITRNIKIAAILPTRRSKGSNNASPTHRLRISNYWGLEVYLKHFSLSRWTQTLLTKLKGAPLTSMSNTELWDHRNHVSKSFVPSIQFKIHEFKSFFGTKLTAKFGNLLSRNTQEYFNNHQI